ncbi:MAG: DUF4336 domain-containing protein [Alphaproteobacteria bacterium]|nr:DUF4336 domain-containing protein [Alphaproteobacteria bacterium]
MSSIRPLADDVWVVDAPLSILGLQLGTRCTLLRLADGGLWMHSPVPFDDETRAAIAALGPVRAIVAPNTMHYLYLSAAAEAFPDAQVFVSAALAKKRPELAHHTPLTEAPPPLWVGEIEQRRFEGSPRLDETVFFHRASGTVVLTDIIFNVTHSDSWWTRTYLRMANVWQRVGPSRLLMSWVEDKAAASASVLAMCDAWDFDRVCLCHGDVIAAGGRAKLREAWTL